MMGRYIILGGFEICYFATFHHKLGDFIHQLPCG